MERTRQPSLQIPLDRVSGAVIGGRLFVEVAPWGRPAGDKAQPDTGSVAARYGLSIQVSAEKLGSHEGI
jgi:hypothetical protein